MEQTLFYIIIAIILAGFVLERVLETLNLKYWSPELPAELEGIYDREKYRQSQEYFLENHRLSRLLSFLDLFLILGMLLFGGFALLDSWVRGITENAVVMSLLFFGILFLAMDILHLPFSVYDTFVIEEKYDFNRTTPVTFVTDKLKSWLLGGIIGGGLLSLVVLFWQLTGPAFWLWAWVLITGFSVFMAMFYSTLIVPLFNKQTPLQEGSLRSAIETFSRKVGFRLDNIYVIDGSKRSSRANAYFAGLGKKKRIVLFDTLLEDLAEEEVVAVLAHEVGHYRKNHIWWGLLASTLQTGIALLILSFLINQPVLAAALGITEPSFHIGLLVFGILYSPVSILTGLLMNILSRKNEFQADRFAREHNDGKQLASALRKLSVKNLSNLKPHPAYVFFHYSHPPLLERLKRL